LYKSYLIDASGAKKMAEKLKHRRYECTIEGHNKFWEIWIEGDSTLVTKWGAIGTSGSENSRLVAKYNLDSEYEKLVSSKLKKGYVLKTKFPQKNIPIKVTIDETVPKKEKWIPQFQNLSIPDVGDPEQVIRFNEELYARKGIDKIILGTFTQIKNNGWKVWVTKDSLTDICKWNKNSVIGISDGLIIRSIIEDEEEKYSICSNKFWNPTKTVSLTPEQWSYLRTWLGGNYEDITKVVTTEKAKEIPRFSLIDLLDL
jgi:predicted DNA-binding WGR domain protein